MKYVLRENDWHGHGLHGLLCTRKQSQDIPFNQYPQTAFLPIKTDILINPFSDQITIGPGLNFDVSAPFSGKRPSKENRKNRLP